jgi:hypothetical protein
MCEGKDRKLYWVVAANTSAGSRKSSTHLFISSDGGSTWTYSCPVATDEKVTFSETSVYETPKGDLVAVHAHGRFQRPHDDCPFDESRKKFSAMAGCGVPGPSSLRVAGCRMGGCY